MLKENSVVSILNLRGIAIGNDGILKIIEGLRHNRSLFSLNLKNNGIN
jgi:hypothetical protein